MVFSPFGAVLQVKSPDFDDFDFVEREYSFGLYDEKGNEIKPEYISGLRTDDNKLYYCPHSTPSLEDTKLNY
jgi:hypothetical protein